MSAGNAPTSLTLGSSRPATETIATNPTAATMPAVTPSHRASNLRATTTAAIAARTETSSIAKYSLVRLPMVLGSPTAGGVAGYFRNGTSATATNPIPATSRVDPRAESRPRRPMTAAAASAVRPPSAVPTTAMPVSRPKLFWSSREISTMPGSFGFGLLGCDLVGRQVCSRRFLERDGVIDLRLAEGEGDDERDDAGDQAGGEPADQERGRAQDRLLPGT